MFKMFKMFKKSGPNNSELVNNVLVPQLRKLESEGELLTVDQVTFIYLMIAASVLDSGRHVELLEIKELLEATLVGDIHQLWIANGYGIATTMQNYEEVCQELEPVVVADLSAERPSFLVRYTYHAREELGKFGSGNFDPREYVSKPLSEI